ncbi:MAG: hypothetical protein EBX50_22960 [Chitinophagia bacterium]|nr:hypothetical protein [Chitinophagia bacterium]
MNKNVLIGSFVFYKKLQSIAKILAIDFVTNSYTIECNDRIIDTDDNFLDFDLVKRCLKTKELEIYSKELKKERDQWRLYSENVEKERDEWKVYGEKVKKERDEWKLYGKKVKKERDEWKLYANDIDNLSICSVKATV